jgi:hypothetical protein
MSIPLHNGSMVNNISIHNISASFWKVQFKAFASSIAKVNKNIFFLFEKWGKFIYNFNGAYLMFKTGAL